MAYQKIDVELLQAALYGYQRQYDLLSERIADIRQQTSRRAEEKKEGRGAPRRKRKMSAEGRQRIAEATRKRWEAYRAAKAKA